MPREATFDSCQGVEYRQILESKLLGIQTLYLSEMENRAKECKEKEELQLELAKIKEKLQMEQDFIKKIAEENQNLKIERDLMVEELKRHKKELSETVSPNTSELLEKIDGLSLEKEKLLKSVAELNKKIASKNIPQSPAAMSVGLRQNLVVMVPVYNGFFVAGIDLNRECHRLAFENRNMINERSALLETLEMEKTENVQLKQELETAKKCVQLYKHLIPVDFIQDEENEKTVPAPPEKIVRIVRLNHPPMFYSPAPDSPSVTPPDHSVISIPSDDEK